jgi:hypothetical protein
MLCSSCATSSNIVQHTIREVVKWTQHWLPTMLDCVVTKCCTHLTRECTKHQHTYVLYTQQSQWQDELVISLLTCLPPKYEKLQIKHHHSSREFPYNREFWVQWPWRMALNVIPCTIYSLVLVNISQNKKSAKQILEYIV